MLGVIRNWALVTGLCFLHGAAFTAAAYPLSEEQEARLEKYIPKTYAKLSKREPVMIVGLGDNVMRANTHNEHRNDSLYSFVGRFAHRLEREFFYTGGVKVLQPENGAAAKLDNYLGPEISIQNLASDGAVIFHALQRLTTDAFLYQPDLILLNFGTNDAMADYPPRDFRLALEESIAICKQRGVDVIVLGCVATLDSKGPTHLGLERIFADAARSVAERKGVLFVDFGSAMIEGAGAPFNVEPERAMTIVAAQVKNHFDHGSSVEDFRNPDADCQEFLGDRVHAALFEKAPKDRYTVSGSCTLEKEGRVQASILLRNDTEEPHSGYFCALDSGRWLTSTNPYHSFELLAGESKQYEVGYQIHRSLIYPDAYALERWGSGTGDFFPLLIADDERTQIAGFSAVQKPVHVIWQTGFQDEVREAFKVGCRVINTAGKALKGAYTVRWGSQETKGEIELKDGESKELQFTLNLPKPGTILSLRSSLDAVFSLDGKEYQFRREIEAIQNLSLGQRVALARVDRILPNEGLAAKEVMPDGILLHAAADEKALYVVFDIPKGLELKSVEGKDALVAELAIDARSYGERRKSGFVDKIRVGAGVVDGPGKAGPLSLGLFGNGYNKILDPEGIASSLATDADGNRTFTVAIPRHYLHLHEWQLGNANSLLGFNPVLQLLDVSDENPEGVYPATRRYVFTSGRLSESDPQSLPVLELSDKGTGRWSVRFY